MSIETHRRRFIKKVLDEGRPVIWHHGDWVIEYWRIWHISLGCMVCLVILSNAWTRKAHEISWIWGDVKC